MWPSETQNHLNLYCEAATEQGVDYLALEASKEIQNKYVNYDYDQDITVIKERMEAEAAEKKKKQNSRRR